MSALGRRGQLPRIAGRESTPTSAQWAILLPVLFALKLLILFLLAWHRRFVMDEFQQLGWAKYLGHGLYTTIWPAKALGFTIFIDLAHHIGWDARSMLLVGRMEMALLACGTLAMVFAVARTLGQSHLRAALILLVLLSFSNFIERIFETRAEPLAVFFALAALLVSVRGKPGAGRILAAGVLSGLAFLSTQKSVYFDVALGAALVGDAMLDGRFKAGIARGALLVLGWLAPLAIYCLAFGGGDPLPIADNLIFGPVGVASPQIAAEYGGLRQYVVQTLSANLLLYLLCVAGMLIASARIRRMPPPSRISLIFSWLVTALVFSHNQPWPYVFVMALPFMALWALEPFDLLKDRRPYLLAAGAILAVGVAAGLVRNVQVYGIDNRTQLALVARADSLLRPGDVYFDGVGMLPNRPEPSTLWLDRHATLTTLRQGKASEAYRIFAERPPMMILWSYRMDAIAPLVAPLIRDSYVPVSRNIRLAGVRLLAGTPVLFKVPVAGTYGLYDSRGKAIEGAVSVEGVPARLPLRLPRGRIVLTLRGPVPEIWTPSTLLLPIRDYRGRLVDGDDDPTIFDDVYN